MSELIVSILRTSKEDAYWGNIAKIKSNLQNSGGSVTPKTGQCASSLSEVSAAIYRPEWETTGNVQRPKVAVTFGGGELVVPPEQELTSCDVDASSESWGT